MRNVPDAMEIKRYQYLSSLLPLTVTRSFHVPGVVFTLTDLACGAPLVLVVRQDLRSRGFSAF